MKARCFILLLALIGPTPVLAACSNDGTTLVYVNGITTTDADAERDLSQLEKILEQSGVNDVHFALGYNPTHLDGAGDVLESIAQAFNTPISDYDLDTILTQLASEITTRKVLLVGHSQGTFYTNELYEYLVQSGVSPGAIAVYNIATPASYVAGGGTYLTSANDKVINYVRQLEAEANAPQALPANVLIPEEVDYATDVWGGHLPDVYLNGAATRIVGDITHALSGLSATSSTNSSCFSPPALGVAYALQNAAFSVADPMIISADVAAVDTKNTIASVANNTNTILHTAFSDVVFSVIPQPNIQNAASAFAVEKALYGSSLSEADYEALVQGSDVPEVAAPAPQPVAQNAGKSAVQTQQPQVSMEEPTSTPAKPPQQIQLMSAPALFSISPGFGGGAPVATVQSVEPSSDDQPASGPPQDQQQISSTTDATSSEPASTTPPVAPPQSDDTDASSTTSEDATSTATSTVATSAPIVQPQVPCGQQALAANGYFFSASKDDAEYSAEGWLEYHFEDQPKYSDGRPFYLIWSFYDDQCDVSGPLNQSKQMIVLPAKVTDWSVRFSSQTHFDVWDDADATTVAGFDIPVQLPAYTSIAFTGSIDGSASTLVSRGLKMSETGSAPTFPNAIAVPAGCQSIAATGYFFDQYESAEYVNGLLQVHLRLKVPYNDGRPFLLSAVPVAPDCSFTVPSLSGYPQTSLTPYIRYFSFRMTSPTHWVVWNDENDVQMVCASGCAGDVATGTPYVAWYASVDSGASTLRTTPYQPTQ